MRHRADDPLSGRLYRSSEYPEVPEVTDPVVSPIEAAPEPVESTPEPVLKAAAIWGSLATGIVTVLGILVALNKISADQAAQINVGLDYVTTNLPLVVGSIVGLVSIVSGLAGSTATALVARRKVRPVAKSVLR